MQILIIKAYSYFITMHSIWCTVLTETHVNRTKGDKNGKAEPQLTVSTIQHVVYSFVLASMYCQYRKTTFSVLSRETRFI